MSEAQAKRERPRSWGVFALKVLLVVILVTMPASFWAYMRKRLEWEQLLTISGYTAVGLLGFGVWVRRARSDRDRIMRC